MPKQAGWNHWIPGLVTRAVNALQDGARLGNSYEGTLYRWPLVADVGMLYWRTDLMTSPPQTPEDLVRIGRALQAVDQTKYGFVWQGRQYEGLSCDFLEVLEGFGGAGWILPAVIQGSTATSRSPQQHGSNR